MAHQFHTAFHSAPGNEGGVLNLGPVAISADLGALAALVRAFDELQAGRTAGASEGNVLHVEHSAIEGTDWAVVGHVADRNVYTFRYRGVAWETAADVTVAAVAEVRIFLAGSFD